MGALLRRLPLAMRGWLHGVELVQFSLDAAEARAALPPALEPRLFGGRALVSLVNVDLRAMRPRGTPRALAFRYRHVAFRVLVEDGWAHADGRPRGVFFAGSFCDRPLLARLANELSDYRLAPAAIEAGPAGLAVRGAAERLSYALDPGAAPRLRGPLFSDWEAARAAVGSLDRAYAADARGELRVTRILRRSWPLEPLAVRSLATDRFETARLECAFRVPEPVEYTWLPARRVPGARAGAGR